MDLSVMFNPNSRFVQRAPGIKDCQRIVRVAKPDVLRIQRDLQVGRELSNTDQTLYRYYCEALLVFVHMQRPRAVEAMTVSSSIVTSLHF